MKPSISRRPARSAVSKGALDLFRTSVERLLADNVLAGLEGAYGRLDVERVRQGDVDGLDVRICQQPVVAAVRALDALLACVVLGALLLSARDRDHLGPVALPHTGQHGRVDPSRRENAPANGLHRPMIYAPVVKLQEVARGLWRCTTPRTRSS